ncbi:MAG: C25 family cysteine peptidase [Bacteroidia bacterium]
MKKTDKIILTNLSALNRKYGKNVKHIRKAIEHLIKCDAGRGISTSLFFLDQESKAIPGYRPVLKANDPVQNKLAIDCIYKQMTPDYILLLGSQDVIPHIQLQNLADKEDKYVNSDLPYACEASYSTDPGKFIAPSRVVGRLPDITGGRDHRYLMNLLRQAALAKPLELQTEIEYFAVCVPAWKNSAKDGLRKMFHDTDDLKLCPPQKPHKYTQKDLQPRIHFFNCHGNKHKPEFYGQQGDDFPMALSSHVIQGKISQGTAVAAECCYGADLYDPSPSRELPLPNTYLLNGALIFLGSTTVAYGAASGQGQADLLTQYFVQYLLQGASSGRAFLQARLDYMHQSAVHKDPADLKTISQFLLLGDPSVQFLVSAEHQQLCDVLNKQELQQASALHRRNRRILMHSHALSVKENSLLPKHHTGKRSASVEKHIARIARHYKLRKYEHTTYSYDEKKDSALKKSENNPVVHCHHLVQQHNVKIGGTSRTLNELLIIQEAGGVITHVKHYHAR